MSAPEVFAELSEEAYQLWRHSPITAAYLEFLGDQALNFREGAADMWENGQLDVNSPNPMINANMLRGRVLTLRELHDLKLEDIKAFYSQADDTST